MPTLQQLPQAVQANPTDLLLLGQQDETCSVSVATLLAPVQPKLTMASGTLVGRISLLPGGPEPVQLGLGLAIRDGALGLDTSRLAPLDSPDFIGSPRASTPPSDDVSRALATTEYVQAQLLDRTTVSLGARLPEIDASDARVTVAGGVARGLGARAADVFNVRDFGAKGDVVRLTTAITIAAGSTMLQASGASFNAGDIGKLVVVSGAGAAGGPLATLIASVMDGAHVALASPAATQVAGAQRCVCYGSDDAPAITSAVAAAAIGGGRVAFPAGAYGVMSTIVLPEIGSVQFVGCGHGDTELVALAALGSAVVSKGTMLHRDSQLADLRIDANALAAYALDLQCAEGYHIDRMALSNATVAGLRIGDGVHAARGINVTNSRIENDGSVFGDPVLLPPQNVIVNGIASFFSGVVLANARLANLRDYGFGANIYVGMRARGHSDLPGNWEAQYGYWVNGAATLLACEVDGIRGVANATSASGVNGAGIRIDGPNVRVIGATLQRLASGAVGVLLTPDASGSAPGNCYIAGNQIDIGGADVAGGSDAIVQQGTPRLTTVICDNAGAALQQGTSGVVMSGVAEITPASSGVTTYQVSYADPQTFCVSQPLSADLVIVLLPAPNLGARYRCFRTSSAGGIGVVRVRPTTGNSDGSGDVAVLPNAASFVDVDWDGGAWQLTSQGSLDRTQLTLSGGLAVTGPTSLQVANAVTPLPIDNSTSVATTAFVKAQSYLASTNNLSDLGNPARARNSLGLGSLAVQDSAAIAVTGGVVDGTAIGRTVPSSGNFSTLSAAKLTLTGGGGLTETGDYVNLQSANGLAAQLYVTPGSTGFLVSSATNSAVTLSPGQMNADLVLRGSGTGAVRAPAGLAVNGGTLSANVVGINGGTIDGVTLGATVGLGPIKGVAKAQLFEASWEAGAFAAAGGAAANDTLTVVNASNAHLSLWSPTKSLGWGMNVDTTGNLRLLRAAGSGGIVLGNATPVVIGGDLTVSGTLALGSSSSHLGFYGGAGIQRPIVTGSRGGNGALASLLSALAGLGLVTDSSTA